MKKFLAIFMAALFMGCFANFAQAAPYQSGKAKIGIFLDAPTTFASNEDVRKLVPEKAKSLFPATRFELLSYDDSMMALRTYREDNDMVAPTYSGGYGTVGMVMPLKRTQIQEIAKPLGCKYALFIMITNDAPRYSSGFMGLSTTAKTTVTCNVRLLDVETGKYVMNKEIVKDGKSTAIYSGMPSFDKAYIDALQKALDEIQVDSKNL